MFKHFERANDLKITNLYLANLAQDASINEILRNAGKQFPANAVFPETFKQKSNLTWEERYRLLLKSSPKFKAKDVCAGGCGTCSGSLEDAYQDPNGRSQAEINRACVLSAQSIVRYKGNIANDLIRLAQDLLGHAKVNWRQKLARVVRGAVISSPGFSDLSWRRPSRRQAGLGCVENTAILPALQSRRVRVSVIIDTSGSMGESDLGIAIREVDGILRSIDTDLDLCTCDAEVHGIKKVKSWKEAAALLKGGGGTDMRPAFDALMSRKIKPEVIICMTDGILGDGVPENAPSGMTVIWVLIGSGHASPCGWGEQIEISSAD